MLVNLKTILLLAHICALCLGLDLNRTGDPPRTTSPPFGDLGYEYEQKTGQWYKFHTEGARWTDANSTCVSEGAHLAIINSPIEARVLKDLIKEHSVQIHDADSRYWVAIGIYRESDVNTENMSMGNSQAANESWKTVDGQILEQTDYSSWCREHPLPYPAAAYGFMSYAPCTLVSLDNNHTFAFICEK